VVSSDLITYHKSHGLYARDPQFLMWKNWHALKPYPKTSIDMVSHFPLA